MPVDLNELRARILAGQPYTREEMIEALSALRVVRTEAATKTTAKRAKAAPIDDASLDADLAQLGLDL